MPSRSPVPSTPAWPWAGVRSVLLAVLSLAVACQGTRLSKRQLELIENHLVTFDAMGQPMNPETDVEGWELGDQAMTPQHYQERVRLMMERARQWLTAAGHDGRPRRLLVFVHGGLNDYTDSRERVLERAERMKDDGYWPIFVAWDSGLVGSYWDDLVYQEGDLSWLKLAMSPFAVVRDLVVGVLNIPPRATRFTADLLDRGDGDRERIAASVAQGLDAANQSGAEAGGDPPPLAEEQQRLRQAWQDRVRQQVDFDVLPRFEPAGLGGYYRYSRLSPHWLTAPVTLTTSLLIDAFGKGAWQGMIRRTKRLFDDEDVANIGRKDGHVGMSLLMRELGRLQASLSDVTRDERRWLAKGVPVEPGPLVTDHAQRGLELLRRGLRRLLEKVHDPRYGPELEAVLDAVRALSPEQRANFEAMIVRRVMGGPPGGAEDRSLGRMIETVLRLMYPGEVGDLPDFVDALVGALEDLGDGRPAGGTGRDFRERIADLDQWTIGPFVRDLLDYVETRLAVARQHEAQVAIFAHSMGTIIVNEILRRSAWFPTPRFRDVVYMGAACSIRDYEDSVFPYLAEHKGYLTQFHNLMLHPRAEDEEVVAFESLPRGSLLVYIDAYLTSPSTVRDRTLGRFANIMLSLDRTQPDVADQIHMKVFPVGGSLAERHPETHGGFTPARFWEPEFFRTRRQLDDEARAAAARAAGRW